MHLQIDVLFIAFAASSFLEISDVESKVWTISLTRRGHTLETFLDKVNYVKVVDKSANVSLKDVQDLFYFGPMTVGTPKQNITVLFDSGSSDLWLPSAAICSTNASYCTMHSTYNHNTSSTYVKGNRTFNIYYQKGAVSGYTSQDSLTVAELPVVNQLFGEATTIDSDTASTDFDGIMGLAYEALSFLNTNPPFVNMILQKVVDQPVFAFYLNKVSQQPNSTGELVLGGVDPNHYVGDITYTPVVEWKYWKIRIDGMLLGSQQVASSSDAIPDSGTSLLYGPMECMNKINMALGGQEDSGLYFVNCSNISEFPNVAYIINGVQMDLTPDDYILEVPSSSGNVCISTFVGSDTLPFFILGDVFMRKYYTVFDMGNNQVGFALASSAFYIRASAAVVLLLPLLHLCISYIQNGRRNA